MIVLRALSVLLSYPTQEMRRALPEIPPVIRSSPLIAAQERPGLLALVDELSRREQLDAEEYYVAMFDRSRAISLHLFEHLYGDSRERGTAMVELKRLYERAGFDLTGSELPDFLPVLLEYLSCCELAEVRDMLADCAHILRRIAEGLIARESAYAAVLQALLVIAGEQPVDPASVRKARDRSEDLDRDWFEEPAFAGVPLTATRARTGPEQP